MASDRFKQFRYEFSRSSSSKIGLTILMIFIIMAIVGRFVAPHNPLTMDQYNKLLPPFWMEGGSQHFWLGTDDLGRDILSRLLYGASISLLIGFISVGISLALGVPLGLLAGYAGGKTDRFISRCLDIMLSVPSLLLAIVLAAILGPSLENAMIAIGIVNMPRFARVTRAQTLSEKSKEYFQAGRSMGASHLRLMFITLLPNCLAPIIVHATLSFSSAILEAAALSFVGLGAQPPTPEWGAMLNDGRNYFHNAAWVMTFPGLAIFFSVLGFNLLGDGLRDILDPRLRD